MTPQSLQKPDEVAFHRPQHGYHGPSPARNLRNTCVDGQMTRYNEPLASDVPYYSKFLREVSLGLVREAQDILRCFTLA